MSIAERKAREKEELRQKILQTAAAIYIKEGFNGTTIRKIAEAVEYSPRTIYLYFKDKDALFHAMSMEAFSLFARYFQTVPPMKDPMERLHELGRVYIKFAMEHPGFYDLMFILKAPMNADYNENSFEIGEKSKNILRSIVSDCMDAGYFKGHDKEVMALAIWAQVHGLATLYIRERMKMYERDHITLLKEALEAFNQIMKKY